MENFGVLALLPPVLAIILAVITKNIIISLAVAMLVGTTIIGGWNPFVGIFLFIKDFIYVQVADSFNMTSITNLLIIGGFVAVMTQSGGALAFAKRLGKYIDTKSKAQLAMWFGGIFIWFSDSANALLIGPVFGAIGDRLRVSREKFAYILDATASPVCSLVPIISWGVYIMSLIDKEIEAYNLSLDSWSVFIKAVPFQFYSILTILMVGFIAFTQWDYGPMLRAEARANSGKLLRDGATPLRPTKEVKLPDGVEPQLKVMLIPLLVLLGVMFYIFAINGFPARPLKGLILRIGLAYGYLMASVVCIVLAVKNKIFSFNQAGGIFYEGMKDMTYLGIVLILAWSLGSLCKTMGTADYIISVSRNYLNPGLLPLLVFFIGCVMSLATGSSWGPYAILMPIAIPIAINIGASIYVTVGAVISGGLFGDHCSPLSDTTLLASMGAASDHIDHFETQFPYALTVALVSGILLTLAGFWSSPFLLLALGIVVLGVLIYLFHKISMNRLGLKSISEIQFRVKD